MTFENYLKSTPSPYSTVAVLKTMLTEAGFTEAVSTDGPFEYGKGYFIIYNDTCLAAFIKNAGNGLTVSCAHTDFPVLKIKSTNVSNSVGVSRLFVEAYGGLIHHSYLNTPLKAAGRICFLDDNGNVKKKDFTDIGINFIIPDAAIHANRDINKGASYSVQKELMPFYKLEDEKSSFTDYLAKICETMPQNILSYDLSLVDAFDPSLCGADNSLLAAEGLDDRAMVYAVFSGIINNKNTSGSKICIAFNHEECGSMTSAGAKSAIAKELITSIFGIIPKNTLLLSCDMAHATHPAYPQFCDEANPVILGRGIAVKSSWNQSYSTDPDATAKFKSTAIKNNIPFQNSTNNSDKPSGTTIGPMLSAMLGIPAVDIGIPLLSMHALRETAAVKDIDNAIRLFEVI